MAGGRAEIWPAPASLRQCLPLCPRRGVRFLTPAQDRAFVSDMANHLNTFFAAMADPTRRAVIEQLTAGRATVTALAAPHDMALPSFMRHLKVLEDAGLVRTVKKGRVRTCVIEPAPLIEAQGWLEWQRAVWESRNPREDTPQD